MELTPDDLKAIVESLDTNPEKSDQPLPMPEGMTGRAASVWQSVTSDGFQFNAAELELLKEALGTLTELDSVTQEWEQAGRPRTAKGSMGQLVEHPLTKMRRDLKKLYEQHVKALGLLGTDPRETNKDTRTLSEKRSDAGKAGMRSRYGTSH
ncbi:hypothetical protein WG915_04900 [Corynebacterium sp. H128]|uniref:hypothetical protein n=1 Tax=Corynebacterium sp. H128 TaxID=3133427 RepID=UPI0030A2C012